MHISSNNHSWVLFILLTIIKEAECVDSVEQNKDNNLVTLLHNGQSAVQYFCLSEHSGSK